MARLKQVAEAALSAPGQWQRWYGVCALGALAFVALTFTMKGRWRPSQARADQAAHEARVAAALHAA